MNSGLVRRLYAYRFLDDFILIYPLYQVMFAARGLSIGQISWLFVIWSVVSIVADVPTGVLADRYSRKNLLALGQIIRAGGFLCWLFVPNFWGFAAGFALWGIGSAFDSGTFQALLFDELKLIGRARDYVKIKGRAQSLSLIGELLATLGAAVAVSFGYTWLLWASVAAVIAAAMVAFTIPEAPRQEDTGDAGYFSELWAGIKEAFGNPPLLAVILLGGFIGAMYGSLEEYTPIFFQDAGWAVNLIPLGVAALVLMSVAGSMIAHRFENLRTSLFIGGLALAGLSLAGSGLGGAAGVILLGGFFLLTKILETIYDGKLQHGISSHRRATITSVGGFAAEILGILVYIIFGAVAERSGTVGAFEWFGVGIAMVAGLYFLINRQLFSSTD